MCVRHSDIRGLIFLKRRHSDEPNMEPAQSEYLTLENPHHCVSESFFQLRPSRTDDNLADPELSTS